MKATGIIRRVDDLGRIVIPKEIRRTLLINFNDPLEIFVEDDGIKLKKSDTTMPITSALKGIESYINEDDTIKAKGEVLQKIHELQALLNINADN